MAFSIIGSSLWESIDSSIRLQFFVVLVGLVLVLVVAVVVVDEEGRCIRHHVVGKWCCSISIQSGHLHD